MKKVELSQNTIEILKNFAQVNPNMLFQPGNVISTIAEAGNIFAYATVEETFENRFGVHDLTAFLAVLSSFQSPVLEFSEEKNKADESSKYVTISEKDGKGTFRYFGSPEKLLKFVTKQFNMPPVVATVDVSKTELTRALRSGAMAQLPHFMIESNKKTIDLVVGNIEESSANNFRLEISEDKTAEKFTMVFDINNLRLMPGSYKISMDGKLVAQFKNEDKNVSYFVAIEKTSTYGKLISE